MFYWKQSLVDGLVSLNVVVSAQMMNPRSERPIEAPTSENTKRILHIVLYDLKVKLKEI